MDAPPKKLKNDSNASKIIRLKEYQPLPLAQLASRCIVERLSLFKQSLPNMLQDIKDLHLKPALLAHLKKKFAAQRKSNFKLTTNRVDSECVFTPDGNHIISTHCSNNSVEIYSFKDILNGEFRLVDELDCNSSTLICVDASKEKTYYITQDHELKELKISNKLDSPIITYTRRARFKTNIPGRINRITPHSINGVIALATIKNEENEFARQDVHWLSMSAKPYLLGSVEELSKKIIHVHAINDQHHALIQANGAIKIVNTNGLIINEWDSSPSEILSSCINTSKTKIAMGDKEGKLIIYDIANRSSTEFSYKHPFSAITFYDDAHIIAAHNVQKTNEKLEILLSFWNLSKKVCIGTSTQSENLYCNTLALSPNKKHLLLGMGYYDIAVHAVDSFEFNLSGVDLEKLLLEPTPLPDICGSNPLTAEQKVAFFANH